MDREEIERPGFPVGRRGYDQAAVDEHLRRVADELERLRGAAPARAPLSAGTSEQVRLILEAAEQSASALRDDAGRRASDHVERVQDAADGMLRRVDELQAELGGLVEALRASGERLADGLAALNERVADVHPPVAAVPPVAEPAAVVPDAPVVAEPAAAEPDPGEPPVDDEDFAAAAPAPEPPTQARRRAPRRPARQQPAAQDDDAGARIIALNMALDGSPREETATYLAEHFTLADPDALLDDVYARAGG